MFSFLQAACVLIVFCFSQLPGGMATHIRGDEPAMDKGSSDALTSPVLFRFSRFSKAYRSRLLCGLKDLQTFCKHEVGQSLSHVLGRAKTADRVLASYVMRRHHSSSGKSLSMVKHALLGCQHVRPALKSRLTTSWENLRVWEEQKVGRLRPPLPIPLWCMMIGLSRARGLTSQDPKISFEWLVFATLLELGVLCLLRPGELMKLKKDDIALPGDFSFGQPQAALRIDAPKNRRHFGKEQFVTLKHPNVISWLKFILVKGETHTLWPSAPSRFGKLFKIVIADLNLQACRFTPGSLRPGGATLLFSRGTPIAVLRFTGRWTAERSLEHYIQQAMSTQIVNKLSLETTQRLKKLGWACFSVIWHADFKDRLPSLPKERQKEGAALVEWAAAYAELGC